MDKLMAFSSFSIMKKPHGDPVVAGFESLTPPVFQVAEQAKGSIARAKVIDNLEHLGNVDRDWGAWGHLLFRTIMTVNSHLLTKPMQAR